jgi:hypothetical protein
MGTEIDQVDEFEALLAERSRASSSKRDAWGKLSNLFEHFRGEPTEDLAKAIGQSMAVYALRDRQYRAACDAVNDRPTAKHPSIAWNHEPLQFAPGEGMTTKIGPFWIEVQVNQDRPSLLYAPQVGIHGKPIATDVRGLPSGDPVPLEELLDRCVGFLQRRLESALETIGETGGQNQ